MTELEFGPGVVVSNRYRIEGLAGRGGASAVYQATDLRHERPVAIKVLNSEFASENAFRRFLQEIRFEAKLQHPNIVPLHDSGVWLDRLFCVMPFVDGETLRSRLRREGALPVEDAVDIACELSDALAYAHRQGIVHRDVKPENVLLHEGHALLTDFGISRALEAGLRDDDTLTTPGIVIGTPLYMSPEQAGGSDVLDGRSDVYSLGCLLYEMLTGHRPFTASSPRAVLSQHSAVTPTPVRSLRPRVPEHVAATAERMLEKTPADRFPAATGVIDALRGTGPVPRRPNVLPLPSKRIVFPVAALAVLVAAAIGLWLEASSPPGLDPNRIVVFPLQERGLRPNESGAGVEVAYMVLTALEHADPLVALDAVRHLSMDASSAINPLDPAGARRLAEELGARFTVDGVVRRDEDSLRIVLVLRDTHGDSLLARRSVAASADAASMATLSMTAVRELLPEVIDPEHASKLPIEALGSQHPSAVALWIQGEREYRNHRMDEARVLFTRAVAADSTATFAAVRAAQAASWTGDFESAVELMPRAAPVNGTLPPRYAVFVGGLVAYLGGNAIEAESQLKDALEIDPGWPEAHAALGEVYYHLQPRAFNLDSLAQVHFEAAVESDSAYIIPRSHLAEMAARRGDHEEADAHIQILAAHDADPATLAMLRLMRDCAAGVLGADQWRAAVAIDDTTALHAAKSLAEGGWQPVCAEEGLRVLLSSDTLDEERREGAVWLLQGLFVSKAMPDSARALLDSVLAVDQMDWQQIFFTLNTVAGAPMVDCAQRTDSLLRKPDGSYYLDLSRTIFWILGVWNAWEGDTIEAALLRDALSASIEAGQCEDCAPQVAALGAHIRLAAGDTTGALAVYDTLFSAYPPHRTEWRFAEPLPVTRLKQAEIHAARNEHFEAIRAASLFDGRPAVYQTFLGRSLEIRYQQSLAWGDRGMAEGYRRRLERLGRFDVIDKVDAASAP